MLLRDELADTGVRLERRVAVACMGVVAGYEIARGVADGLLVKLGISGARLRYLPVTAESKHVGTFLAGRAADLEIDGKRVGTVGALSVEVCGFVS